MALAKPKIKAKTMYNKASTPKIPPTNPNVLADLA